MCRRKPIESFILKKYGPEFQLRTACMVLETQALEYSINMLLCNFDCAHNFLKFGQSLDTRVAWHSDSESSSMNESSLAIEPAEDKECNAFFS
jgi:hypothetical protein